MKAINLLLLVTIFISGCAMPFLQMDEVRSLKEVGARKTAVIYYRKIFTYSDDGRLKVADHLLMQVGDNRRTLPDVLTVFSGPTYKLTRFGARIISLDGGTQSIGRGDLYSMNLSGDAVTQNEMLGLSVSGSVNEGDIIEEYTEHEVEMPQLGVNFSLDDVGEGKDIECSVSVPPDMRFRYLETNDSTLPKIIPGKNGTKYIFHWSKYVPADEVPVLAPQNSAPGFLGYVADTSVGADSIRPWQSFGDWYLNLIADKLAFDDSTKNLAEKLTAGLSTEKEKMDALFNYCQKNIRYEQVYLRNGEFVPNSPSLVLKRNYGDCKDYSAALYSLAHSIGLDPRLALCYRGRGELFYPNIPVNQFNHMLIYFRYDGKDYWYDGTDTQGIPGLTSNDLINQDALVLEKGNSRIIRMKEESGNKLVISGSLQPSGNGFTGDLSVSFYDQYAVDLFYAQSQLSPSDLTDYINGWVRQNLNGSAVLKSIDWSESPREFTAKIGLDIPNCSTVLSNSIYTSLKSIFPHLFPTDLKIDSLSRVFYFPFYDRVELDVHFVPQSADSADRHAAAVGGQDVHYSYAIEPGPLLPAQRSSFLNDLDSTSAAFRKSIILDSKGVK